jgi:hypothetical protein
MWALPGKMEKAGHPLVPLQVMSGAAWRKIEGTISLTVLSHAGEDRVTARVSRGEARRMSGGSREPSTDQQRIARHSS